MIREVHHRPVARSELGRGASATRPASSAASRVTRPRFGRRHHLEPLHQRGNLPRAEADPRRLRHQQRRHLRPVCHSPDRLRPGSDLGTSAGTQTFKSVEQADVMLVIGANPSEGTRCSRRRMKSGCGGRAADRHRSARIDLVKSPHAKAGLPPAACPAPTSPSSMRAGACHRHRGLVNEAYVAERCDPEELRPLARVRREARELAEA